MTPLAEGKRFWLIWSPRSGRGPRVVHATLASAEQEATRLSQKYPGRHFYVLEPIGFVMEGDEIPTENQARRAALRAAQNKACDLPPTGV